MINATHTCLFILTAENNALLNGEKHVEFTIDTGTRMIDFEFRAPDFTENVSTPLQTGIASVNGIKIFLSEGDFNIDKIVISTTAYSPFVHKEDFDSTYY